MWSHWNCLQNVHVCNSQGTKTIGLIWISVAGVPSPRATDGYQSLAWWEQGRTAGGEQWAGKQSFICIYSCSPSLHYRLSSASCERQHNKYNTFASSHNHSPTLVCGKPVFHKTGPWCQKDWGLLQGHSWGPGEEPRCHHTSTKYGKHINDFEDGDEDNESYSLSES